MTTSRIVRMRKINIYTIGVAILAFAMPWLQDALKAVPLFIVSVSYILVCGYIARKYGRD